MPELHFNKTLSSLASEIAPELCGFFRNETVRLASLTRVYYSNSLVGVTLLVSHKLCGARLHFQILNANLLRFEILHTDRRPLANLIMRFSLGYHSFLKAKLKLLKYFEISTAIHMLKGHLLKGVWLALLSGLGFRRLRVKLANGGYSS